MLIMVLLYILLACDFDEYAMLLYHITRPYTSIQKIEFRSNDLPIHQEVM